MLISLRVEADEFGLECTSCLLGPDLGRRGCRNCGATIGNDRLHGSRLCASFRLDCGLLLRVLHPRHPPAPLPSGCRDSAGLDGTRRNEAERRGSSFVNDVAHMTAKSATRLGFATTASRHSIPGASTLFPLSFKLGGFRHLARERCMRVTVRHFEEPDGTVRLAHRQVHVPKRRLKILVPRELLDRERGRPLHREMRTERVAEDVKPTRTGCASPGSGEGRGGSLPSPRGALRLSARESVDEGALLAPAVIQVEGSAQLLQAVARQLGEDHRYLCDVRRLRRNGTGDEALLRDGEEQAALGPFMGRLPPRSS